MDNYLENSIDYAQEAFESAQEAFTSVNEWIKENDPLPNFGFPMAEAYTYSKTNKGGATTKHSVTVKVGGVSITSSR